MISSIHSLTSPLCHLTIASSPSNLPGPRTSSLPHPLWSSNLPPQPLHSLHSQQFKVNVYNLHTSSTPLPSYFLFRGACKPTNLVKPKSLQPCIYAAQSSGGKKHNHTNCSHFLLMISFKWALHVAWDFTVHPLSHSPKWQLSILSFLLNSLTPPSPSSL